MANPFKSRVRRPVRRTGAENYLLIILLSFAASVAVTRLFLEVTGYPRLESGGIHIAHVLWGGLFLFVAALLPLLLLNRWAKTVAAVLAGVGVGLFIDEVGKFITSTNDYFHPAAAPIIYAFFMLVVFLYAHLRSPSGYNLRSEMYWSLDTFGEVLDRDLDMKEQDALRKRLENVIAETDAKEMKRLAQDLLNYLDSEEIHIADDEPDFLDRFSIWWRNVEDRWLTLPRLRAILIVGFLIFGILDLINMGIMVGTVGSVSEWNPVLRILSETGYRLGVRTSFWFGIRAILEAIVGITMIVASLLILAGRDKQGVRLGEVALIISFAVVNLFVFYFEQFSSITFAVMQFLLLLGVFNYQRRMGIQQSKRYFEE